MVSPGGLIPRASDQGPRGCVGRALAEVEQLGEFIDARLGKADAWRRRKRFGRVGPGFSMVKRLGYIA